MLKKVKLFQQSNQIVYCKNNFIILQKKIIIFKRKKNKESEKLIKIEKLKSMKIKMEVLMKIPKEKWNDLDLEFMKIASDPKMDKLFNNVL